MKLLHDAADVMGETGLSQLINNEQIGTKYGATPDLGLIGKQE